MEQGELSKPYDSYQSGEYLQKNPTWDDEDSDWKAGKVMEIMRRNDLQSRSIADVGCGAGGVLGAIRRSNPGVELHGFEIAPDASRFWQQYADSNINFVVGDFFALEIPKFDTLLVLDVIEHVPDPFEFLTRLLDKAEHFVFHIPLDLSAVSVAREKPLLYVRDKVGHIHYYTKSLALALLAECGYEVLDWNYTGAAFDAPQSSFRNRLARFPRRLLYALNRDLGVRLLGGDTLMVLATPTRR